MPTDRELMQQALDTLEAAFHPAVLDAKKVMDALRARLAQPEAEPVGEVLNERGDVDWFSSVPTAKTLIYTDPPRKEWQGLTDEEAMPLVQRCADYYGYNDKPLHLTAGAGFWGLARTIEAKLREKNA